MADRFQCPTCEAIRDVETVERDEKATVKGREISFKARLSRCTVCGNDFETPEQLDANIGAAREAYARLCEAPSPAELVSLRSRYGASQKAFGLILGFGELTMNSYEKGAPPDSTNRLLLRLAENPVTFRAMYEVNRERIGAIQRQRIESSEGYRSAESPQRDGSRVSYDEKTDVLRVRLDDRRQDVLNQRISHDVVLDIGPDDHIVGIEIMNASRNLRLNTILPARDRESRGEQMAPDSKRHSRMNPDLSVSRELIGAFCRKHGIRKLAVFGSALGQDFGPASDVDVLVEFEHDRIPGLLGIARLERELSPVFGGRKVDLRTPQDLSRYFRQSVIEEAEVQYAQG